MFVKETWSIRATADKGAEEEEKHSMFCSSGRLLLLLLLLFLCNELIVMIEQLFRCQRVFEENTNMVILETTTGTRECFLKRNDLYNG